MEKESSKIKIPYTPGIALLTATLLILCLITLCVIALSSANNEKLLSQKRMERTTAYYNAVSQAENKLYELNTTEIDDETEHTYVYTIDDTRELVAVMRKNTYGKYCFYSLTTNNTTEWEADDSVQLLQIQ